MAYNDLENFYRTQFVLRHVHHWPLSDQNEEIPWEREIHMALLGEHLDKLEEEMENARTGHR